VRRESRQCRQPTPDSSPSILRHRLLSQSSSADATVSAPTRIRDVEATLHQRDTVTEAWAIRQ
jgi:hypothetical protein